MTGYQGPRKTVLVVDDVAENRAVVVDMLGQIGFQMAEAASGGEGLEQAQALQPDLILMDIVMPEMGGLEAARRLRQLPARRRCRSSRCPPAPPAATRKAAWRPE